METIRVHSASFSSLDIFLFVSFRILRGWGVGRKEERREERKRKKKVFVTEPWRDKEREELRPLSLLIKTVATGPDSKNTRVNFAHLISHLSSRPQATACHYFPGFTNEETEAWRGQMPFVQITPMGVSFMSPQSLHISEENKHLQPDQSTSAGTFSAGTKSPLHNSVAPKTSDSATQYSDSKTGLIQISQRFYEHTESQVLPQAPGGNVGFVFLTRWVSRQVSLLNVGMRGTLN